MAPIIDWIQKKWTDAHDTSALSLTDTLIVDTYAAQLPLDDDDSLAENSLRQFFLDVDDH